MEIRNEELKEAAAARPPCLPCVRGIERPENSPVDCFQRDRARPCAMGPNAPALGARVWQAQGEQEWLLEWYHKRTVAKLTKK